MWHLCTLQAITGVTVRKLQSQILNNPKQIIFLAAFAFANCHAIPNTASLEEDAPKEFNFTAI